MDETNINHTTIINNYRAAPMVNNTVINNYTVVKNHYNYSHDQPTREKPGKREDKPGPADQQGQPGSQEKPR